MREAVEVKRKKRSKSSHQSTCMSARPLNFLLHTVLLYYPKILEEPEPLSNLAR